MFCNVDLPRWDYSLCFFLILIAMHLQLYFDHLELENDIDEYPDDQ